MNAATRTYVAFVALAGAAMASATAVLAWPALTPGLLASTAALLLLALVTELIAVPLPRSGELVASTIVHVAAIFILPLPLAVLVAAGSVLVGQIVTRRHWSKQLFNVGQTVLSVGLPALLIHDPGRARALLAPGHGGEDLPVVALVLVLYYLLNSLFISVAISLSEGISPLAVWWENNRALFLPDFGMEVVGVLVAYVWQTDLLWSGLTLIPAAITVLSFKHIRRIEDEAARNAALLAETRRLNARLALLADAGEGFNSVLDPAALLRRVAETCAEPLGAGCVVSLLEADGRLRGRAVHPTDGASARLVEAIGAGHVLPRPRREPPGAGEAIARRRVADAGADPAIVLDLPLWVGERLVGWLSLARRDGRDYDESDVQLARGLADRAASAIENARLFAEVGEVEAIREMQRLKTDFVAGVGHELRSPITLISGYSELLIESAMPPAQTQVMVEQIHAASQRLCRLIDDLLDISRLESGRLRLNVEPMQLGELVRQAVEQTRSVGNSHRFAALVPAELPTASGDPLRVRQVIDNLLSNAVRYSPDGSTITVRVEAGRDGGVFVAVRDEGIGITEEQRTKVFEKFYRADHPAAQKTRGLGLGLAICRQIVEAQGGRIWVESEPGRGSTFSFTVPAASGGAATAPGPVAAAVPVG
jgi:signal transduction histidine kinase